ncbi:MAG TPA: sugar ABC transporter substrate-binding protein [Candidatus Binatia bacterium]|nr:sugar ABC transporter substrate-binding protein [Candidatus Binatia bacterium]
MPLPLVACGALALAVGLATGCRSAGSDDSTVELWAMGREGEVVQRLVPGFEESHPGVRVRVQQIPWSAAHEKLLTAFAGGALPDVLQLGTTWIAEFVALGALEPLDERLAQAPTVPRDDFFPGILDAGVVDGATWALPWYVDTRLLFYRADLLRRAGIDGAPRTWETWRTAMERVRSAGGPGSYAILLPLSEWEPPVILAMQQGATLLRDGDARGDFQSPAFRAGFAFYLDLFRSGLAPKGGEAQATNLYQGFAEGLFSFLVTGPWNLGELRARLPSELAEAWSTAAMPAPDADWPGVSLAGGASLAVSLASPRKDAAWEWVAWLCEAAQQLEFQRLTGDLPARRSAWRNGDLASEPRAAAFWTQLARVRPAPKVPEWERIAARIAQHAESAIRGQATIDDALARLDADADLILEKRRWLRARASGTPAPEARP